MKTFSDFSSRATALVDIASLVFSNMCKDIYMSKIWLCMKQHTKNTRCLLRSILLFRQVSSIFKVKLQI